MHLIIPHAASSSEGCRAILPSLKLPNLQKLLTRLSPQPMDSGDEFSLSPPHERALAQALGLPVADGQIAWAALQAHQQLSTASAAPGAAWAFVSLCHWQVNSGHMSMSHLPLPDLTATESDALLCAMRPYFEEDGIALHADQAGRWLAQGAVFADLATASIDRVVGRSLDPWMPSSKQAAPLRLLQNEMQMLLYTHPVYDARVARGVTPANSVWFHGSGQLPAGYQRPDVGTLPTVTPTLEQAALTENWPAWREVWAQLDADAIKTLLQAANDGQPVKLTLCGERHAQSWQSQTQPVWKKLISHFGSQPPSNMLEKL